jgi:hypothetical protein
MGRTRKTGHERYVKLRYWLLNSSAWKSLPSLARALYLDILTRYNGSNNGRISYSVREGAASLHVTKDTVSRGLKLLQERGFLVCTKLGYFTVKTTRDASEWRLTEYDDDVIHHHATKTFMSWQPAEPDTNENVRFRKRSDKKDRTVRTEGPLRPIFLPLRYDQKDTYIYQVQGTVMGKARTLRATPLAVRCLP